MEHLSDHVQVFKYYCVNTCIFHVVYVLKVIGKDLLFHILSGPTQNYFTFPLQAVLCFSYFKTLYLHLFFYTICCSLFGLIFKLFSYLPSHCLLHAPTLENLHRLFSRTIKTFPQISAWLTPSSPSIFI